MCLHRRLLREPFAFPAVPVPFAGAFPFPFAGVFPFALGAILTIVFRPIFFGGILDELAGPVAELELNLELSLKRTGAGWNRTVGVD